MSLCPVFFFKCILVGGGAHFSNNIKMSTKIMLGAKNLTVCSCTRAVIRIVLVAPVYSITSLESGSGAGYFQGAISKNVSGTQLSDPTLRLCPHSQSMEEDWLQHLTNTPAQIINPVSKRRTYITFKSFGGQGGGKPPFQMHPRAFPSPWKLLIGGTVTHVHAHKQLLKEAWSSPPTCTLESPGGFGNYVFTLGNHRF